MSLTINIIVMWPFADENRYYGIDWHLFPHIIEWPAHSQRTQRTQRWSNWICIISIQHQVLWGPVDLFNRESRWWNHKLKGEMKGELRLYCDMALTPFIRRLIIQKNILDKGRVFARPKIQPKRLIDFSGILHNFSATAFRRCLAASNKKDSRRYLGFFLLACARAPLGCVLCHCQLFTPCIQLKW